MNKDTAFRKTAPGYLSAAVFVSLSINIVGVAHFVGGPEWGAGALLTVIVLGLFVWAFFPFVSPNDSTLETSPWVDIYRALQKEQQSKAGCTCDAS